MLLGLAPDTVAAKLQSLTSALGPPAARGSLEEGEEEEGRSAAAWALRVMLASPGLWRCSAELVRARADRWRVTTSPPRVVAKLFTRPALCGVCGTCTQLARRAQALRRGAAQVPEWGAQLAAMRPGYLGRCLSVSDRVLSRLDYVAHLAGSLEEEAAEGGEEAREGGGMLALGNVLLMSAPRFDARFPDFAGWRSATGGAAALSR